MIFAFVFCFYRHTKGGGTWYCKEKMKNGLDQWVLKNTAKSITNTWSVCMLLF